MKKMKKILAMLLALAMILGMSLTSMAANNDRIPDDQDTATVTILGLTDNPTVTLYQIARGKYGANGQQFIEYEFSEGVAFADEKAPTSKEITEIANGILDTDDTSVEAYCVVDSGSIDADGTYTATVHAGMYIAIITGSNNDSVYNPILLSAYYDSTSTLVPGWTEKDENGNVVDTDVNVTEDCLTGSTAIAKKTTPGIDKVIVDGTVREDTDKDGTDDIHTAGLGSKVDFQITPTMPSYPVDAINKTFFVADTMSDGLTFDFSTLNVTVNGTVLTKVEATINVDEVSYDVVNYKSGEDVVAVAYNTPNGFNLNFDYSTLIYGNGNVYAPTITYSAIVNKDAVVGDPGNPNNADLYYTTTPNNGQNWDTPISKPDQAEGIKHKFDQEIVYTYQLSFLKTGEGDDAAGLAGAIFGIYTDAACTQMIDKVTTNANGYAVSTNVKAGTYYVKELAAPAGYSLNTEVFQITASWATATIKDRATVTDFEYTTIADESADGVQVGWISGGKFYEKDEFSAESDTVKKAYVKSTTTTSTTSETMTANTQGGGTVKLEDEIPNTKLIALPSTGGIGTTIFTVAGCGIMIAAAFFFFASRKKENE